MCENLTSEVMRHKNCRRSDLSDFTYSPGGFKEYDNNASGHNRNSNDNDSNINDNNNRNTDNKHKNINKGNIHFCNS